MDELLKVTYSQIKWFESRQRTVILHARNRDIVFYAKLSDVYEQIRKTMFYAVTKATSSTRNK